MPVRMDRNSRGRAMTMRTGSGRLGCGVVRALAMARSPLILLPPSSPPQGDELGRLFEHSRLLAEWRQRQLGIGDKRAKPLARRADAEQGHERRLAARGVLGRRLAHGRFVALGVEQIVGELK